MTDRIVTSKNFFLRAVDGMIAARQRQANRHVAAYLATADRPPVDFGGK